MKTVVSIAAAAGIGLAGVAASASGASANGWGPHGYGPSWHPHPHYGYQYRPAPDNGGALIAGALFGLAAGAIAAEALNPPPPPEPDYPQYASAYDVHVAWCRQTYTSYDARSDSWVDFEGGVHPCLEPAR